MTSRPFECPVAFPVTDRRAPVAAYPSLLPAGADEAEADTAQRIASDPSVIDAERNPLYGDRVQDLERLRSFAADSNGRFAVATLGPRNADDWRERLAKEKERVRLGRLSRWQEQR